MEGIRGLERIAGMVMMRAPSCMEDDVLVCSRTRRTGSRLVRAPWSIYASSRMRVMRRRVGDITIIRGFEIVFGRASSDGHCSSFVCVFLSCGNKIMRDLGENC